MKTMLAFFIACVVLGSCKPDPLQYRIRGEVYEGGTSGPHLGGQVKLLTKSVQDGVLQDYFVESASMGIEGDGSYGLDFDISNLLACRLIAQDNNYYSDTVDISPDAIRNANPFTQNFRLYKTASVRVHLVRTGTYANVNFNWVNANFQCDCCSNATRNFPGLTDTTFACPVYGEYWLKYFVLINSTSGTTTVSDSIYCQPYQENLLELNL